MSEPIRIRVLGDPAPQGSKKAFALKKDGQYTGRVSVVESSHKRVKSWRADVVEAASQVKQWPALEGPLSVSMVFYLKRPQAHYRTGRNSHLLRPSAPAYPAGRPDSSKLLRATEDALTTAGIYKDDAQIVNTYLAKMYADNELPGAEISIRPLPRGQQ